MASDPKTCFEALRDRVMAVARLNRACAVGAGVGQIVWKIGGPLLIVVVVQGQVGLPFYVRAPVLPAAVGLSLWWLWRLVLRPLMARYSVSRAAMLVEERIPAMRSRLISALELYPEVEKGSRHVDPDMVRAVVVYAQESTADRDFREVIDRRPARRHLAGAAVAAAAWVAVLALNPAGMWGSLTSLAGAWDEVGALVQKAGGARIDVLPLDKPAYLVGSDITIRAVQKDFRQPAMEMAVRAAGSDAWKKEEVKVGPDGKAEVVIRQARETLEFRFVSGIIESPVVTAIVTERPRIVKMTLEYEYPEYVRRAPVVQPNSDGGIKGLYGSTVVLTLEANKTLAAASIGTSFAKDREPLSIGGRFARGILRLDQKQWLGDTNASCRESYRLQLRDEYGFGGDEEERAYDIEIVKDQAPSVAIAGVPHRSSDEEPHVLEDNLAAIIPLIQARDDYGVRKIVVHCRLEDLETNTEKGKVDRDRQFALPMADIPRLRVLALTELGAKVGDRIVYWAEVEDAYDLEPDKGPHKARTPNYRFAVVSQEELFADIRYSDSWSVDWYDKKKVATLSQREAPARMAPESEPAALVAARLLDAPPVVDSLRGVDQQLVQDYYDSLNTGK